MIACSKHPGHLYMMTRADLWQINYAANGPESYLLETWDDGKTWRVLSGNRTVFDMRADPTVRHTDAPIRRDAGTAVADIGAAAPSAG